MQLEKEIQERIEGKTRDSQNRRPNRQGCSPRRKRGFAGFMKMEQDKENAITKRTFRSALIELFEREYKMVGSHKVIELIAEIVGLPGDPATLRILNKPGHFIGGGNGLPNPAGGPGISYTVDLRRCVFR